MPRRNPRLDMPGVQTGQASIRRTTQYSNVGDWVKAASNLFTEMQDSLYRG